MFKKHILLMSLCTGIVGCILLYLLTYPSGQERNTSTPFLREGHTYTQYRTRVQKDLWLQQDSRLHCHIESESSTLALSPLQHKRLDVSEKLHSLQCWMQEKLYFKQLSPMQQVRVFKADEGTYQYSNQTLKTSHALFSLLELPGNQLPTSLQLPNNCFKGSAKKLSFSFSEKRHQKIEAEEFKLLSPTQDNL